MSELIDLLLPQPQHAILLSEGFVLPDRPIITFSSPEARGSARRLADSLMKLGYGPQVLAESAPVATIQVDTTPQKAAVRLELVTGLADGASESYELRVDPRGIRLRGGDPAGLAHSVSTLLQWLRIHLSGTDHHHEPNPRPSHLQGLDVSDRPSFAHRGVLLDISRDKVPTLATLRRLIDLLAGWKINQIQLYMEHTFAYRGHDVVWRDASPLTAEDICELDSLCRERHIELVPNQNSFGHFHRWLVHEPYRQLAETPEGIEHPFSAHREPYSLCPTDPRSFDLLAELYDQLLPCFSSRLFNVGLDETFDLGFGRSATACAKHGKGRLYLDYLQRVHSLVSDRGHRMQFWGDVILSSPDLLEALPRDAIALEWGYDSGHPFAADTKRFRDSGLEFYVCPGTSSWNSFAGRTHNALENLADAAVSGLANGASGYLITDWGDNGHWQPLPVSYPGFAAGAAFAWNASQAQRPHALPLARLLDLHAFSDQAGVTGRVITQLGQTYREIQPDCANGSPLFFALMFAHKPLAERRADGLTAERLERALAHVERSVAPLADAQSSLPDADQTHDELRWVADVLRHAVHLSEARVIAGEDQPVDKLPQASRRALARDTAELIERHRENWLARNRPGGLDRSVARLAPLRQQLDA